MKNYQLRLLDLRKEKGYTQQFVAEYLKIDRSNYSKYERKKLEPSIEMLVSLAELYGVTLDYIVGRTDY